MYFCYYTCFNKTDHVCYFNTDGSFSPSSKLQIYHPTHERSDFYHMADLSTKPILFNPIIDFNTSSPVSKIKHMVTLEHALPPVYVRCLKNEYASLSKIKPYILQS